MKTVLFVCVENSCRSQIAEGFARRYGQDIVESYSAGSRPSGEVNPDAIAVMQETGIDISTQSSKGFDSLPLQRFDYVITMGCQDFCPFVPAQEHLEWKIADPKGKGIESFRATRDEIKDRVRQLIRTISRSKI